MSDANSDRKEQIFLSHPHTHDGFLQSCDTYHCLIIGDIKLPKRVEEAMQMQVEAERKKRAAILQSEG